MEKLISYNSIESLISFETFIHYSHSPNRRVWISSSLPQVYIKAQILSICEEKKTITLLIDPIPQCSSSNLTALSLFKKKIRKVFFFNI